MAFLVPWGVGRTRGGKSSPSGPTKTENSSQEAGRRTKATAPKRAHQGLSFQGFLAEKAQKPGSSQVRQSGCGGRLAVGGGRRQLATASYAEISAGKAGRRTQSSSTASPWNSLQDAGEFVAVPVLEAENDKVSCRLRWVTAGERAR